MNFRIKSHNFAVGLYSTIRSLLQNSAYLLFPPGVQVKRVRSPPFASRMISADSAVSTSIPYTT